MPLNFKVNLTDICEQVSEMAEFINSKIDKGCRFYVGEDKSEGSGFSITTDKSERGD